MLFDIFCMIYLTFHQIKKRTQTISYFLSYCSNNPPDEPTVEAPAKPPLSDDDDDNNQEEEIIEEHFDEAHYDSVEKDLNPPGDFWASPSV